MYKPQRILSENSKTDYSLNLPVFGHCIPTPLCLTHCYAKTGRICMKHSRKKQEWVSKYLLVQPYGLKDLILECRPLNNVRLCGSGDLLNGHVSGIKKLANECPDTMFWGMTRKTTIANRLNDFYNENIKLLVSVDHTSPDKTWYYEGALCFGPRMPEDTVLPDDDRIKVVFPYHVHGHVGKGVQTHKKDCKAVWHKISGCRECGRCWKW